MKQVVTYLCGIICVLMSVWQTNAQELTLPPYTQYLADNPFILSPTFAGIGDHIRTRLNGVTQWVGVKDAPDTQSLAIDMRVGNRSGLGAILFNDRNGYTHTRGARVSFAHHLTFDAFDNHYMSFGLSYNYNQFRIDTESFDPNDPSVNDRRTNNHNFDVGFLYRLQDFYFSLNASNLLNKDLDLFAINEPNSLRNYYIYTGYKWRATRTSNFEIEPSVFFQLYESDQRSNTDMNVRFRQYDLENSYWAAISYRFLNDQFFDPLNITPMVGFNIKNFFFAYGYQVTLNELIGYNSGTHMITIGFDFFQGMSECPCTQKKSSAPKIF
ncbi:type IX secretion system membrane protein, PorP/SprF family [Zhouia amylolytica]|uniref:Type IX secretion system membrane protein, PorP/SprF family n=2 Tax=Zhouia amylolytica TaxID=376730 RepID=A0A1I6PQY4_9FLAO|nr:bacteroidetes-specific putative membrane protein [Zhouia amylolytica AD3]SFS42601.1 type IX secretion system membrane protein, PorP/SprF family [Zhouia amylolytica]